MKWPLEEDAYETTIEQLEGDLAASRAGTRWRWKAISPEIQLTLTLASTDPNLILRVEESAKANGIVLERITAE